MCVHQKPSMAPVLLDICSKSLETRNNHWQKLPFNEGKNVSSHCRLSTESPLSQKTPPSWGNQDSWSPSEWIGQGTHAIQEPGPVAAVTWVNMKCILGRRRSQFKGGWLHCSNDMTFQKRPNSRDRKKKKKTDQWLPRAGPWEWRVTIQGPED